MIDAPFRVLVTGGARGLGRSLTDVFLARGAHVTICSRNARAVACGGPNLRRYAVDISSMGSIDLMLNSWQEDEFDLLVNNAGAMFWEAGSSAEGYDRTIALNYLGPVYLTTRLLKSQLRPLSVINVGSSSMYQEEVPEDWWRPGGSYDMAGRYSLSKALLASFTAALLEKGVVARCVDPGLLRTELGAAGGMLSRLGVLLTAVLGRSPDVVAEAVVDSGLGSDLGEYGFRSVGRRRIRVPIIVSDPVRRDALFQFTQLLLRKTSAERHLQCRTPNL